MPIVDSLSGQSPLPSSFEARAIVRDAMPSMRAPSHLRMTRVVHLSTSDHRVRIAEIRRHPEAPSRSDGLEG
jgi:hypothetical protein